MILSYRDLRKLVEQKVITDVHENAINAASIDVRLGGGFLHERKPMRGDGPAVIDLIARQALSVDREELPMGGVTFLDPGDFVLAHTIEKFNLPDNISAKFMLKSSIARSGLNQLSAVWCDAGWNGSSLTLELSNVLRHHRLLLTVGQPIGQMIFYMHAQVPREQSYAARGRYNNNPSVQGVLP